MYWTGMEWTSVFWLFPLLCMAFMAVMIVMMFTRGGCMHFGAHGGRDSDGGETAQQGLERRQEIGR